MASVVDFSSMSKPIGPLVAGPIDAITAAIKQQQDDEEKKQLLQMTLDQRDRSVARLAQADENKNAYYQRKQDLLDKRENARLTMDNQKRQGDAEKQIRSAVGNGDLPLAKSIGARYQQMEPSGDVTSGLPGLDVQAHGGQQEPVPADALTAAMSNPVTRLAGMSDADINQARGPEAPPQDFQQQHDQWQGAPDVIALHGQPLNQDEIRHSAGRAAAQDFQAAGDYWQAAYTKALDAGDQQGADAAKRKLDLHGALVPLVESGQLDPGKASQMLMAGDADQRARDIAAGNNASRVEAANVAGQFGVRKAETAATAKADATGGVDPKVASAVESQLQHFQANHAVSTDRNEEARLSTLMTHGEQPVVQRAMASVLARALAGERGALSNQDVSRIQGDMAGAWADVENWLSKKGTGQLAPEVYDALRAGVQAVLDEKAQKRASAEAAFESSFLRPSSMATKWGLHDYALDRYEEMFGHPYSPPKNAGRPAVDPNNPDDPNAPNADRPLDGDVPQRDPNGVTEQEVRARAHAAGIDPDVAVERVRAAGKLR